MKKILCISFLIIGIVFYLHGSSEFLSLTEYIGITRDIAHDFPIIKLFMLFIQFIPLIVLFFLIDHIEDDDDFKYAYFCNMILVALTTAYGLFQALNKDINAPDILCWILAIVVFIGMMLLHKGNKLK